MNIKDVKVESEVPKNIWQAIFEKQMELAEKYKDIEGMGNLLETTSNNINTRKGQKWIKDFSWRVTEELAEAQEAKYKFDTTGHTNEDYLIHYWEELIDATHFLTELTIIAGYKDYTPLHTVSKIDINLWDIVYHLGLMCNTLKNKPWKQTEMLTDRSLFEEYLNRAWSCLLAIFKQEDLSDENIYNLYFKKNKVNQFRIRSKY